MPFILLGILFFISTAWSQAQNLCDLMDLKNCAGVSKQGRRTSSLSLPSPSTSSNLNPATVSYDRGLGVEAIHQAGNPTVFNIASGTGKVGGAVMSSNLENSFFANRVFELDDMYLKRRKNRKQYKNKKISVALGLKGYRSKHVSFDAGIILKRHSIIKKVNTGVGISGRIGPLNLGTSVYQDDLYIDLRGHNDPETNIPYRLTYNADNYTEKFTVSTYSVGTKIRNLALDVGVIKTKFKQYSADSEVHLYSGSFFFKSLMFNFAARNEISPAPKFIKRKLDEKKTKTDYYGGVQASIGKHFILGVNYNYFLLDEYSLMASVFF